MTLSARPLRSALYLPATNLRALEKARSAACDAVILDLEDAVGPDDKAQAREQALAALAEGGFGHRTLVVRINGLDTPWGADDLAAVAKAGAPAVLIPKVSAPADLAACAKVLPAQTRLWAMIETCRGVLALDALGQASVEHRCDVWVMGLNDLAKEMRCRPGADRAPMMTALTLSLTAARGYGLSILDAVFNDFADLAGLERECVQGAGLGFDGKTVIHPAQLAVTNAAFSPDPAEVSWAQEVVNAFDSPENSGKGVIKVNGRMVERLHLVQARRLLAVADAIAAQAT